MTELCEVAVTLPVPGRYHYRVPDRLAGRARIGVRVLVRFGARKVTGVVVRSDTVPPEGVKMIDLSEVLDDHEPALSRELVDLCLWVADYYEAPPGEAMRAALPAGSGVIARKTVSLTELGAATAAGDGGALPPKHRALLAKLAQGAMPIAGMSEAMRRNLDALRARGLVAETEQRDKSRVRLRHERVVALADGVEVEGVRAQLARSKSRLAVIEALVAGGGPMPIAALARQVSGATTAVRELVKTGLVRVFERELTLGAVQIGDGMTVGTVPQLTAEQAIAVAEISAAMQREVPGERARTGAALEPSLARSISGAEPSPVPMPAEPAPLVPARAPFTPFLLHGVTGSGKTEVYLRVIASTLDAGKTAIVLVPEISLTPQLAARFRARFGDQVAILHSGLSEQACSANGPGCAAARRGSPSGRAPPCSRRSTTSG